MKEVVLQKLFQGYLEFLKRTVRIEWTERETGEKRTVFGFWHEDSYGMNLILDALLNSTGPIYVIVTADKRGDYIEKMIRSCRGEALRVPDGRAAFRALKEILQEFRGKEASIAVALDGPLGPRHRPKKLAFYLSEELGMDFTGIALSYSCCLRIRRRWDNYAIPLPFSRIRVRVHNYGQLKKSEIPDLPFSAGEKSDILKSII